MPGLASQSQNSLLNNILHSQARQQTPEAIRARLESELQKFKVIGVKPVLKKTLTAWLQDTAFRRIGAYFADDLLAQLSSNIQFGYDDKGAIAIDYIIPPLTIKQPGQNNAQDKTSGLNINENYDIKLWWQKDMKDTFYKYQLIDNSDFSIYCSFEQRLDVDSEPELFTKLKLNFQNTIGSSKGLVDTILGFSCDDSNAKGTELRVATLRSMLHKMFISLSEGFKSNTTLTNEAEALIAYYPQLLDYSACAMDLAIEEYKKTHTTLNQQKFVDTAEEVLKRKAIPFRENVDFLFS